MKITVQETIQLWNALNAIYKVNDILPSIFDYHMKRNLKVLQEEVKQLQGLDKKDTAKIQAEQIDIPLSKVKPESLPDKMPSGALELFKPLLIEEEQEKHTSAIEQLLYEQGEDEKAEEKRDELEGEAA